MNAPAPTFFETQAAFRRWLKANHRTARELWVGYFKKATGIGGMTYAEAVEEALCFGWIDGIGKTVDEKSYTNRFTPRRKGSHWSAINIARVEALIKARRMAPAGKKAFAERDPKTAGRYSYEQRHTVRLAPALVKRFKQHAAAWRFFESLPRGQRQLHVWRVMSGKQEATRERKLRELIALCAARRRADWTKPISTQIPMKKTARTR